MKTFISIIVPVYNVEKYLSKCIESILRQTYSSFELLLVNDGSSDRCGVICDEYALLDSRIRVFHKENGGVSEARNYGLDYAKGTYVVFLDSDDWIEKDMLETLYYLQVKYGTDLSVCGFLKEDGAGNVLLRVVEDNIEVKDKVNTVLTLFKGDKYYSYQGWVTNKMYKKIIIEKYHIRFVKGMHYSEDRLFNFEYMKYCSLTVFSSLPKYHYVIRIESAMNRYVKADCYRDEYATFIPAFDEMLLYSYANYPLQVRQAVASNYALDVVTLYLKFRQNVHKYGIDAKWIIIIRQLLPDLTFYERNVYRLLLLHPIVYVCFIKLRHKLYLLKKRLVCSF